MKRPLKLFVLQSQALSKITIRNIFYFFQFHDLSKSQLGLWLCLTGCLLTFTEQSCDQWHASLFVLNFAVPRSCFIMWHSWRKRQANSDVKRPKTREDKRPFRSNWEDVSASPSTLCTQTNSAVNTFHPEALWIAPALLALSAGKRGCPECHQQSRAAVAVLGTALRWKPTCESLAPALAFTSQSGRKWHCQEQTWTDCTHPHPDAFLTQEISRWQICNALSGARSPYNGFVRI